MTTHIRDNHKTYLLSLVSRIHLNFVSDNTWSVCGTWGLPFFRKRRLNDFRANVINRIFLYSKRLWQSTSYVVNNFVSWVNGVKPRRCNRSLLAMYVLPRITRNRRIRFTGRCRRVATSDAYFVNGYSPTTMQIAHDAQYRHSNCLRLRSIVSDEKEIASRLDSSLNSFAINRRVICQHDEKKFESA